MLKLLVIGGTKLGNLTLPVEHGVAVHGEP